jgi:hypothetical protein
MCDCAEGDEDVEGGQPAVPLGLLMERTRAVAARAGGEPVPDALWSVFFGLASGSIPWPQHRRMMACRDTALKFLALRAASRNGVEDLRCRP